MKTTSASVQLVSTASKRHRGLLNPCELTLWETTYGTTPQAARRALWHYRDLIETYSAGHKSPGFEELDQVAAEIVGLAASEVLNALAPQTPF